MSKIDYDLSKELLIYDTLKKSIKELKKYYKSHPDSRIVNEKSTIPYLEQQIACLKNINRFKIGILNHFLYYIKRITKILELHKLNGTLKLRLQIILYILSLSIVTTINSSSLKEETFEELETEEKSLEELLNIMEEMQNQIDEITDVYRKREQEKEKQRRKLELEKNLAMLRETKEKECEKYLKEYSNYFNLDSTKVIEIARNLTNDFDNEIIITVGSKEVASNSPETIAMFLVWDLYKNSSDYSLTREELTISDEIKHLDYDEDGNIILRNGLTFSQFMGKVSDSIEGDKCFNLAISNFESDEQTNSQSINQNNFGGWRHDEDVFLTFISPEAGIIYHCFILEKLRNTREYDNLSEFSGIYVNNDKNTPAPNWVDNVSSDMALLASNEEKYFDYKEEQEKENEIMLAMKFSE